MRYIAIYCLSPHPSPVLLDQSVTIEYTVRSDANENTYLVKQGGTAELSCVFTPPLFGDNVVSPGSAGGYVVSVASSVVHTMTLELT